MWSWIGNTNLKQTTKNKVKHINIIHVVCKPLLKQLGAFTNVSPWLMYELVNNYNKKRAHKGTSIVRSKTIFIGSRAGYWRDVNTVNVPLSNLHT